MKIQLIRNATLKLTYAGKTILIDPMLSEKSAMDPFASETRNPTVDLPMSVEEVIEGIDAFTVTHAHPDHYDPAAVKALDKSLPVIIQPSVEEIVSGHGFTNVLPVNGEIEWDGITILRTGGHHGRGPILEMLGEVSGFVFNAEGEPTLYLVGDSVWCEEVQEAIAEVKPEVIITNSGGAVLPGHDPILMEESETIKVLEAAPNAKVIAVHMEALDHCQTTRASLKTAAVTAGVEDRLLIPVDGEVLEF